MRRIFFLLIIAACAWAFKGCKPLPNDGVPVYLQIDSVIVNGQTRNHNVVDVWVEANADNTGAYQFPVTIPILQKNEVRFVISAGVLENGGNNAHVIYPFLLADTFTIADAVPGQVYHHVPEFKYRNAAEFPVSEDFENGNGFGNMGLTLAPDTNVLYGTRCGHIILPVGDSTREAGQISAVPLNEGQEIWVEVDYKSNVPFYVGLYGGFTGGGSTIRVPKLFVLPIGSWNRLRIKFSNEVGAMQADQYALYFEALRPFGQGGQGDVYIDNVKIVQF